MRIAFKEWAVIVEALGHGEQILLFRKGGIHEGRAGFRPEHDSFLLFPTRFHQQRESVIDEAASRIDSHNRKADPADIARFEFVATVADIRHLESPAQIEALRGQHIWRDEVIQQRFDWGREKAIYALALRVARLQIAAELPLLQEYGGCKSWINLAQDISTQDAVPVLDDGAFNRRLNQFRAALSPATARA